MDKLAIDFYERNNVLQIAKELLGKILVTNFNNSLTAGRIVETEAYKAITDKASHSFRGKRTARNEHMYAGAGTIYVYICYGVHHLFNIVTNKKDIPDAVLIRAVEPIAGIEIMLKRCSKKTLDNTVTKGPGNLSKVLGISKAHSGLTISGNQIFIADDGYPVPKNKLAISHRIGVEGSGDAALLPYRFYIKENPFVSGSATKHNLFAFA